MSRHRLALAWCILCLIIALSGCNSGSDGVQQFTLAGTLSGLAADQSLVLKNNSDSLTIVSANGPFSFSAPVGRNGSYSVTVATQPTGQVCTVSNGSGAGVTADIANVTITCTTSAYSISGTVSGLAPGTEVALENNGADALMVSGDGAFTFSIPVAFDSSYTVAVSTQPANETCTVSNGTGAGVTTNVSNISVECSINTYPVGGIVSGLAAGVQVTLDDNGGDPLTLIANGPFTFSDQVAAQASYSVTVGTQPTSQTCTVANGSGSDVNTNITAVAVTCSNDTYTIGGVLSGLAVGTQVTLDNNGADPLTLIANGSFTFVVPVALDGSYAVTVGTQPSGQSCSVSNGSGSDVIANVTTVSINCTNNP